MDIKPFAHPVIRQEILPTSLAQLALAERALEMMVKIPQLQVTEKVGLLVSELGVGDISQLLLFERTFTRVLQLQRRGDDQDFLNTAFFKASENNAANTGIDRHTTQSTTKLS